MKSRVHDAQSRNATLAWGAHIGDGVHQVEMLTARIDTLASHLHTHQRDYHSRRGLLSLVGRRNRLLAALAARDPQATATLAARLGLRLPAPAPATNGGETRPEDQTSSERASS